MHSFNEKKVEEKEPIDVYSLIDENWRCWGQFWFFPL